MPKKYASKQIGCLELKSLRTDQLFNCMLEHNTKSGNIRQATHSAFMMGRPAGYLCKPCMNEWMQLWKETSI